MLAGQEWPGAKVVLAGQEWPHTVLAPTCRHTWPGLQEEGEQVEGRLVTWWCR